MLSIRFKRVGRRHQPSYRIVVAERRSKRDGEPVEDLGFYHPFTKATTLKEERVRYWLSVGAKPTATVHNLFVRRGVIQGPKIQIRIPVKKAETKPAEDAHITETVATS